jgi:Tfp pilus assembly protein FimV
MKRQDHAATTLPSASPEPWRPADAPADDAPDGDAAALTDADLRRRVRELEAELRTVRHLLEVRDEAFRALVARLVAVECQAYAETEGAPRGNLAEIIAERNAAVELANALQNMKVFRYSRWPRTIYGALRRRAGR